MLTSSVRAGLVSQILNLQFHIAYIHSLLSLTEGAAKYKYIRPQLTQKNIIEISKGR